MEEQQQSQAVTHKTPGLMCKIPGKAGNKQEKEQVYQWK